MGYPSSLNIIAEYAINKEIKLNAKTVIGLGDKLFAHYRKNIQLAFKCKIHETYGSSEGFQIGFQSDLDYMYVYSPQVYLELLDDKNNPVKEGQIGNVVVTRLDNKNMPLIRYKLGDLAIMLPRNKFPSNRKYNFPLIERVIVQKNKKGITIYFIPDKSLQKDVLVNVKEKLQKIILDDDFNIVFKKVTSIQGTKSGKPQIIESHIR